MDTHPPFALHVLGTFRVTRAATTVEIGGRRPRSLLAALAARCGDPVQRHDLITEIWAERPPRTAVETLHSYVSRLRRVLRVGTEDVLVSEGHGYHLRRDAAVGLDAHRFEHLATVGADELQAGRPGRAGQSLGAALALWQGEAYADVARGPIAEAEARRLSELRAVTLENRIDADLLLGRLSPLVAELEGLVRLHPLRERLHAQRMLALCRLGRQAEALAAYQDARALLTTELGIEPGPLLRRLQELVLDQDEDLASTATLGLTTLPPSPAAVAQRSHRSPSEQRARPREGAADTAPLVEHALRLLDRHRVVTVTGLPGTGKSRLLAAVEAGARRGTALLVDAAAAPSPTAALAAAVGAGAGGDARAAATALGPADLLLCLDGGAHPAAAVAAAVGPVVDGCPGIRVLVAVRDRLRIAHEHRWRLPGLSLPSPDGEEEVALAPASKYLAERIRDHTPSFSIDRHNHRAVAAVARALDGVPLALEIAAECAEVLPLEEVARRVGTDLDVVATRTRGRAPAHRSLGAAARSIVDPLGHEERTLLAQLGAFRDGFTPEAVGAVCVDAATQPRVPDLLAALLDGSTLHPLHSTTSTPRYARSELVGGYLRQRGLLPDAAAATRQARYAADLAERAAPQVTGADQVHWLNRLHEDHANIDLALRTATDAGDGATAARIVAATAWFWTHFGHVAEGRAWSQRTTALLAAGDTALPDDLRVDFLLAAGRLALSAGDAHGARAVLQQALPRVPAGSEPDRRALTLATLALATTRQGHPGVGLRLLGKLRPTDPPSAPWVSATLTYVRGIVLSARGDHGAARLLFDRAERSFRAAGDEWSGCLARLRGAWSAAQLGDAASAARLHRVNLARTIDLTASTFDFVGLPQDLRSLAVLAQRTEQSSLAALLRDAAALVDRRPPHRCAPTAPAAAEPDALDPGDLLQVALDRTAALL